ncbi:MAG: hypothetical protein V7785_22930 [Bermanella sp.]
MSLLDDKHAALKIIDQYNNAIITCLEQNNFSAMQETYDLRNELITQFFEKYTPVLNERDQDFFENIKTKDASIVKSMQDVKKQVLRDVSSQNKKRKGLNSYYDIAKDE